MFTYLYTLRVLLIDWCGFLKVGKTGSQHFLKNRISKILWWHIKWRGRFRAGPLCNKLPHSCKRSSRHLGKRGKKLTKVVEKSEMGSVIKVAAKKSEPKIDGGQETSEKETHQKEQINPIGNEILPKIIAIILGVAVTGIFAWKFKGTPLCRPWIMLPLGFGVGYAADWILKRLI